MDDRICGLYDNRAPGNSGFYEGYVSFFEEKGLR